MHKKLSSTLLHSFYFYKTDKLISFVLNLLKVGHLRGLILNQVWYVKKKQGNFMKKMLQNYSKLLTSNRHYCWGKLDCFFVCFFVVVVVAFVYLFCREKINQLKASKIPRSFLLT